MQSGGGRELQEEVAYRILYSLRYPIAATAITIFAVLSVVVSLTGPTETGESVEASDADPVIHPTIPSGINDHASRTPDFEDSMTTDAIDIAKTQTQYRETLRLEAVSGTVYTPNFVPSGSLIASITSFTPVQQQPVSSQPANPRTGQPIQGRPGGPGGRAGGQAICCVRQTCCLRRRQICCLHRQQNRCVVCTDNRSAVRTDKRSVV